MNALITQAWAHRWAHTRVGSYSVVGLCLEVDLLRGGLILSGGLTLRGGLIRGELILSGGLTLRGGLTQGWAYTQWWAYT